MSVRIGQGSIRPRRPFHPTIGLLNCLGALFLFLQPIIAQVDTCALLGIALDSESQGIENAELTILRIGTNETFHALTDERGDYRMGGLPVGEYRLRLEHVSFRTEIRRGVVLQLGQTHRQDFLLRAGAPTDVFETEAETSLLNSEKAEMGQVIDREQLEDMPINSRDFTELATLAPGTAPASTTSSFSSALGNIRVGGMRARDNITYVDGSIVPPFSNFKPSVDALQEFEVKTGLYGSDYGILPGGQIVAVTKSGGNEIHGNVFWFHRNDNLDARNFFEHEKQEFKRNQLGGTLGGPVYLPGLIKGKDTAWFFASYQLESVREIRPLTGVVPTAQEKIGHFPSTILDPLTGSPFPNNVIPQDRFDPVSRKLLTFWPAPNTPGALNYTSPDSSAPFDNPQLIARLDFKTSETSKWSGRFLWNSAPYLSIRPFSEFSSTQPLHTYGQSISNQRSFSSGIQNVTSFHWSRRPYDAGISNPKTEVVQGLGVPELVEEEIDQTGVPTIEIQGFTGIGDISLLGQSVTGNWQVKDDIAFQKGRHSIKAGVEFRQHYLFLAMDRRSRFDFFDRYTGNGFANFLLGHPARSTSGGESLRGNLHQNSLYWYLQDNWRLSPTLTLTIGVRQELRQPWKDKRGFVTNFDTALGELSPALQDLSLAEGETGRFQANVPIIEWSRMGAFLPRLGIAYRLASSTALHTGYGIYANEPDTSMIYRLVENPRPGAERLTFDAPLESPTLSLSDPFPAELQDSAVPNYFGVESPLPHSLSHVWGISLQQELNSSLVVDAGYQGSHTAHRLETVSLNDATPGTGDRQARRPYPHLQAIHIPLADADAWYHGMQLRVEMKEQKGLQLNGSFTWSSQVASGGGWEGSSVRRIFRSRNVPLHLNRGLTELHVRRRLVLTSRYEPPFGPGKSFLHNGPLSSVLRGWSVQGIWSLQDGPWFTVHQPGDPLDTGSEFSQWPDRARDPNLKPAERTPTQWFDTSAFVTPAAGVYGNAGRATVEGPGLFNLDLSLRRGFQLAENQKLELRFEIFNATNHANFVLQRKSRVNQFGTADFGALGKASPARQVQVALKYSF